MSSYLNASVYTAHYHAGLANVLSAAALAVGWPDPRPELANPEAGGAGNAVFGFKGEVPTRVSAVRSNATIASFQVSNFPHNCGIAIVSALLVTEHLRGRGVGTYMMAHIIKMIDEAGYSSAVVTTNGLSKASESILKKFGWEEVNEFRNSRSGNVCRYWTLAVSQAAPGAKKLIAETSARVEAAKKLQEAVK